MEFETILVSVLGVALITTAVVSARQYSKIQELTLQKEYLEQNYKAEKELWQNTIQLQNEKLEQYMADTKTYIETVTIKQETIAKDTQEKQKSIAKSLASDSSDRNIIYETNKLLHNFSNGK